jgi:hypothetical protein
MSRIHADDDNLQAEIQKIEEVFKFWLSLHKPTMKLNMSRMLLLKSLRQAVAETLILGNWSMQDRDRV